MSSSALIELFKRLTTRETLKSLVFYWYIYVLTSRSLRHVIAKGFIPTVLELYARIAQACFKLLLKTPMAKKQVTEQLSKVKNDLRTKLITDASGSQKYPVLPLEGLSKDDIVALLKQLKSHESEDWKKGRVSGALYHYADKDPSQPTELAQTISTAIDTYLLSNPLHPELFAPVRKFEAELISMVLSMYNADMSPGKGCGTTTSGGTESIIMACKAYKTFAYETRGVTEPEMVIPISAHAAFDKASEYFGIKIHHIPVNPATRKVNLKLVKRAINKNTILIMGSAPNFPDGIMDDIEGLSRIAVKAKIPLHVDCCLGSFIVPFAAKAGFPIPRFDFRLPGVTSISCDPHKYGFAPKGNSIIMYSENKYRQAQYAVITKWPGGVYASPSIAGSRPGALIAGAYAACLHTGVSGYTESAKLIIGAARKLKNLIRTEIPELVLLGNPQLSVVAFSTRSSFPEARAADKAESMFENEEIDIYTVGDAMSARGWHLNALQRPPALHICITRLTVDFIDDLVAALKEAVQEAKEKGKGKGGLVMLYGLGKSTASGPGLTEMMAKTYLDVLYEV